MSSEAEIRSVETGTEQLLCRVEARVGVLTLNRPEARNALSVELKEALLRIATELGQDPGVGCLLLTGAGGAFCAGGDTKVMAESGTPPSMEERQQRLRAEHRLPLVLHELEKPVIAALPGAAAGAGMALALSCDMRIMAERAFLITSYSRLAVSGDYGSSWFLTHLVGTAKARELLFTADRVQSAECLALGLANRVVPDDSLAEEAMAMARRIAAGPPIALRMMKDNLNRAVFQDLQSCLDLEAERMVRGSMTEDYLEGVAAFSEKRPPVFRGR